MINKIKSISVVIPVVNEEKNIGILIDEIKNSLLRKIEYEVIIVDDGSTDRTVKNIKYKLRNFSFLKLVVHEKNYGQSYSLRTGILHSRYDYIVTLDGDGQNDPSNILDLIKSYKHDIPFYLVIGNRRKRNDSRCLRGWYW